MKWLFKENLKFTTDVRISNQFCHYKFRRIWLFCTVTALHQLCAYFNGFANETCGVSFLKCNVMSVTKVWCLILSYCLWNTSLFSLAYSEQQSAWGFSGILGCRGSEILFLLPVLVPLGLLAGKKRGKAFINTLQSKWCVIPSCWSLLCVLWRHDSGAGGEGKASLATQRAQGGGEGKIHVLLALAQCFVHYPTSMASSLLPGLGGSQAHGQFACCLFVPVTAVERLPSCHPCW